MLVDFWINDDVGGRTVVLTLPIGGLYCITPSGAGPEGGPPARVSWFILIRTGEDCWSN